MGVGFGNKKLALCNLALEAATLRGQWFFKFFILEKTDCYIRCGLFLF